LQEIRCDCNTASTLLGRYREEFPHIYWNCSTGTKGYAGTAILCKEQPIKIEYGFEKCPEAMKYEGRTVTIWLKSGCIIVCVYVPNSGLQRHHARTTEWDIAFAEYIGLLVSEGDVIVCGDLNVAHQNMDIYNPTTNHKTAGFTDEERNNFGELLLAGVGLRDLFREIQPDTVKYSWWSYMMKSRQRNVGWRIDYCLASANVRVNNCDIACNIHGSDHAPVWCEIDTSH
jgi:exodeoxyribonuclease-3